MQKFRAVFNFLAKYLSLKPSLLQEQFHGLRFCLVWGQMNLLSTRPTSAGDDATEIDKEGEGRLGTVKGLLQLLERMTKSVD